MGIETNNNTQITASHTGLTVVNSWLENSANYLEKFGQEQGGQSWGIMVGEAPARGDAQYLSGDSIFDRVTNGILASLDAGANKVIGGDNFKMPEQGLAFDNGLAGNGASRSGGLLGMFT
jgi:hypothetical protein